MRVQEIGPGLHPSEVVVEVQTTSGAERLVIDRAAVSDNSVFVGWRSLAQKNGELLVELPNETMSGTWRIWVRSDAIISDQGTAVGVA
ncbi:hypothetical protein [Bradyrhizobium japonicum]|uniref:hypothetical protein n=1 Tax=Bradyrhizobium japonicum TaxID=375 RepID=UPI0012BC13D7|nr:hypothetical protein [Bradyrhizobium japonicum]